MMPNMACKIGSNNNKIEKENEKEKESKTCNCPKTKGGKRYQCRWGGKCMMEGWLYKCTGKDIQGTKKWEYIGLMGGKIKIRISNHYQTFKKEELENS